LILGLMRYSTCIRVIRAQIFVFTSPKKFENMFIEFYSIINAVVAIVI
jgi:hypothetical protein